MDFRAEIYDSISRLMLAADSELPPSLKSILADASVWRVADPVGELTGVEDIAAGWLQPLRRAFPGGMRRDVIVMGGESRTGSGRWLSCLCHYVGNFSAPLFGIEPHGKLVFLRCGEFYRVEGGRIAEAYLLPDVLDLLRQVGRMPLPHLLGSEVTFPAPAAQDGVLPDRPERSSEAAALVESMLADLRAFEPETFRSAGQTGAGGYWRPDMLWYGPAGIGSNFSYDGFQRDHRVPFLTAFPDRAGGNHFARFGDGDFVCSGGWPSMTMTHKGLYLGTAPTGRALTLRVMDFWRVEGAQIAENWVLLDLVNLFRQMGVDLLERS